MKHLLSKKYDEPVTDQVVWRKDLYKDDPSDSGTAIGIGHLDYRAKGETDSATVVTGLSGDSFETAQVVGYSEKAAEEELERRKEDQALDQ